MTKRLLALLVVLAIAPGLSEIVEAVVHFATYGDLADQPGDHHGTPFGEGEHGCSGTFHIGNCHGGQTAAQTTRLSVVTVIADIIPPPKMLPPRSLHGLPASAPELRPPIA
ncbi:MAG: hypothetical protein QM831_43830 [Kofleriaceae bacterium]